jgi:hypothetical protein
MTDKNETPGESKQGLFPEGFMEYLVNLHRLNGAGLVRKGAGLGISA